MTEESSPCPSLPSPVGICVDKTEEAGICSWHSPPALAQEMLHFLCPSNCSSQSRDGSQGSTTSTLPPAAYSHPASLANPASNMSLDHGSSPAQDSASQCSLEELLDKAQLLKEVSEPGPAHPGPPSMLLTPDSAECSVPAPAPQWPSKPWDFLSLVDSVRPELCGC